VLRAIKTIGGIPRRLDFFGLFLAGFESLPR